MARGVFKFIGSVVGTIIGGPIGGIIGSLLGGFADNAVFGPIQSFGPRLSDLSTPGVNPGVPITWQYGTTRTAAAMIWKTILKETEHKDSSGKGGPEQEQVTYTYSTDVALGICEGPVRRIKRIWADTKVLYSIPGLTTDLAEEPIVLTPEYDGDGNLIGEASTNYGSETGESANKRFGGIAIYYGHETQMPDPVMEANEGAGNVSAHRGLCYVVFDDLQLEDFGNRLPTFTVEVQRGEGESDTLTFIIRDMCERAGLEEDEIFIDSRLPTNPVLGYPITRQTTARAVFEQLQLIYDFDAAETGYQVKFRPRNRRVDALIYEQDFAAFQQGDEAPPLEDWMRGQEYEMPKETVLRFVDIDRDLTPSAVRNRRIVTQSSVVQTFDIPITMHADDAKTAVDEISSRAFIERSTIGQRLPFKYVLLDAGDIVRVQRIDSTLDPVVYRIAEHKVGANGLVEVQFIPHLYQQTIPRASGESGRIYGSRVPSVGETFGALMDLPLLQDNDVDDFGFYAAMGGSGVDWGGGVLLRDPEGSGTSGSGVFSEVFASNRNATLGRTIGALRDGPYTHIDRASTLDLLIETRGELQTISETQLFDNLNVLAIENANGEWEVVKFQTATLIAPNTWRLATFLRGRRGTEYAARDHITNSRWVLLQQASTYSQPQEMAKRNIELGYKFVTARANALAVPEVEFTNRDRRLMPRSPADLTGTRFENSDGTHDWSLDWYRRARKYGGWNNGVDVPLDEPAEEYTVEFWSAAFAAVVSSYLVTGASTFLYTEAQQVADFGSAQTTLHVKVYQLSSRVGRGEPTTETIAA